MPPKHIAILGGGITGLSAAFHLARRLPSSAITLFESTHRLGGWIRSERVDVKSQTGAVGSIVLEAGPRTLRPNSKALLELIHLLDLSSELVLTPKTSPAARNRFLYLPGKEGLTPLPSSFLSVFTSPIAPLLLSSVAKELFRRSNSRQNNLDGDDSFDGLLSRRFGERFARTMGSALIHGIYAADSRKLSVRAAFPTLLAAEQRGRGSIVRGFLSSKKPMGVLPMQYDMGKVSQIMEDVSVYSFRDGMSALADGLHRYLASLQNVRIQTGVEIKSLEFLPTAAKFSFDTSAGPLSDVTHVVSTVPLPKLSYMIPPTQGLPHLKANPSSSVSVLNLVFPPGPPIHPPGFGYLIPRPSSGYDDIQDASKQDQNPGILGVVFDSCALSAQDITSPGSPDFTKLTVMLGGPHPHHTTSIPTILDHLRVHLGRPPSDPLPEPVFARIHHHRDCIPIPTVGHVQRMEELRAVLVDEGGAWRGRLDVIGAGVGGVSVGDCVEAGRNAGSWWT